MRSTPTSAPAQRRHGAILASLSIIGILVTVVFLNTERFYTQGLVSTQTLLQSVDLSDLSQTKDLVSVTTDGGVDDGDEIMNVINDITNHYNVREKNEDAAKHLPIAEELFDSQENEEDENAKHLPIAEELFEGANNSANMNDDEVEDSDTDDAEVENDIDEFDKDLKKLPIADELFEGANNDTDGLHEHPNSYLPIANELFEGANNNDTDVNDTDAVNMDQEIEEGEGDEELSVGKVYESDGGDKDKVEGKDLEQFTTIDHNVEDDDDTTDDDDAYYNIAKSIAEADDDNFYDKISDRIGSMLANNGHNMRTDDKKQDEAVSTSPACHPHFNNQWNNSTKFTRIYLYHARKAAGSTMHQYMAKVAEHYGIKLEVTEWSAMEEPGTHDETTFYVTHLRDPIDRSISHFKYQGRWNCRELVVHAKDFIPTEENAMKIETWNQTGGHEQSQCRVKGKKKKGGAQKFLWLGTCAVNCYTQWFSGVCAEMNISLEQQYQIAIEKTLKYNFIAVIEKFSDPGYVQAVEDFFGVPGLTKKSSPYCERQSHKANEKVPLIIPDDTRAKLTSLNKVDIHLYNRLTNCLDSSSSSSSSKGYNIPKFDERRFAINSYNITEVKLRAKAAKMAKEKAKQSE